MRRARIGAEGELGDDRRYVAEIDLATGFVVPRDVYLAFGDRQDFVEGTSGSGCLESGSLPGDTGIAIAAST